MREAEAGWKDKGLFPNFGSVLIVDVDQDDRDDDERADWKLNLRVRFAEALCEAYGIDHDPYGVKAMAAFGMGPMARPDR